MNDTARDKVVSFNDFSERNRPKPSETSISSTAAPAASGYVEPLAAEPDSRFDFGTGKFYNVLESIEHPLLSEEESMATREEELHDKYLDQRFKNIDDKFEILATKMDSVSSEMKEVKTVSRQSFWAMIAIVFSVVFGFTGLIVTLIRLLVLKQ